MKKKQMFMACCSVLFLVGCGNSEQDKKEVSQQISIVVDQEMSTLDSALATDTYSITALNNVMEGLYRLSADNELELAGASEKPTISEDGLTYTITLNKEAKWSNGESVTANDYVYSWRKAVDSKTASEYAYLFEPIKNAEEITSGKLASDQLGIQAVNDYEIEIELNEPTPYFNSLLAFTTFFPQNEKFVTKAAGDYAKTSEQLLYNGPFVLSDFDGAGTDTTWTYLKNDSYWNNKEVKLDKIENKVVKDSSTSVNLFESGEVDDILLTGELAKQYKDNPAFVSLEKAGTTYLSYNQTKREYQNENVRKAISLVLDRESVVNDILADGSVVPKGLVPSDMSFSPEKHEDFAKEAGDLVKTDIDEAKKLWSKAKSELGISTLNVNLLSYDADSIKKVSEYIQNALEENLEGMKVNVSIVPVSVALDRGNKTDFDLFLFGWTADYSDPSTFLDLFVTDSPHNYGKYSNSKYDELIKKASGEDATNSEKRWNDYIEAEKILMNTYGNAPVIQKAEARLRNTKLKGIVSHSTGAQFDYKKAYIEE